LRRTSFTVEEGIRKTQKGLEYEKLSPGKYGNLSIIG
jgi:hypothetical protein